MIVEFLFFCTVHEEGVRQYGFGQLYPRLTSNFVAVYCFLTTGIIGFDDIPLSRNGIGGLNKAGNLSLNSDMSFCTSRKGSG